MDVKILHLIWFDDKVVTKMENIFMGDFWNGVEMTTVWSEENEF